LFISKEVTELVVIFYCGYTGVDDGSGEGKNGIDKTIYEDGFYGSSYRFG
jgi:hypothetical protein